MRLAIVGSRGQLGAALVSECAAAHEVIAFDRAALDVTDGLRVLEAMRVARPDAIVNASGYNDVDGAEQQPVEALEVNAFAVRTLARAASDVGAVLVHYSSDFVFDGILTRPHTEDDAPNPRSTYAASKLLGEWFALESPRAFVLRVESLFGQAPGGGHKGSVAAIVKALAEGTRPKAFNDRTVTPTYIWDAARATRHLLENRATPGLYHCVNSGQCTWLEFAEEAARQMGVEPNIESVRFADTKFPAARPKYCALANAKLIAAGVPMPSWQDALGRYLESLKPPASSVSGRKRSAPRARRSRAKT
jgi:dTDP-4-dehydrorhamnose reductase